MLLLLALARRTATRFWVWTRLFARLAMQASRLAIFWVAEMLESAFWRASSLRRRRHLLADSEFCFLRMRRRNSSESHPRTDLGRVLVVVVTVMLVLLLMRMVDAGAGCGMWMNSALSAD